IATFGMSPEEIELFDLREMGATPDQLGRARSALRMRRLQQDDKAAYDEMMAREADLAARYRDTMEAIADQRALVAMSAEDQEIWNNLKWAGVEAESELGKAIVETTRRLQEEREGMRDQIEIMDGLRDSTRGFFDD